MNLDSVKPKTKISRKKSTKSTNQNSDYFVSKFVDNFLESVTITNNTLLTSLMDIIPHVENLYNTPPVLDSMDLFDNLPSLKPYSRYDGIKDLIRLVETSGNDSEETLKSLLSKNMTTFNTLKHIFKIGDEIIDKSGKYPIGGKIVTIQPIRSWMGTLLRIQYQHLDSDGRGIKVVNAVHDIHAFRGAIKISSLTLSPITPKQKEELSKRGKIFREVCIGSNYRFSTGNMETKNWWYWEELNAIGRCMIDIASYSLFQQTDNYNDYDEDDGAQKTELKIDDGKLWMCPAYIYGFSFLNKKWGRFPIQNITPIEFSKDAFNQLVLEDDKKKLIKSLVEDYGSGFKDVISGKGGGVIFLLHGVPGTGKTLTSEAVSELLERPLYSVSVGELGITPQELETNLRKILDVAKIWNAVILIDEADIFLERRSTGDVLRNSMVGIFLKLLEYHQGVLFLTTNRVDDFDPAFHSRISLALKYNKLDIKAREKVWTNLLDAAKITGLNSKELAKYDINGRQIKNTIRLAQGVARQDKVPVNKSHIQMTIKLHERFQKEISK